LAIVAAAELVTLAHLNLAAAQKARSATAYRATLDYAQIGIELLAASGWQQQYELSLSLHYVAAEAAFLQGDFDLTTELVKRVIREAKTVLDRVPVYETQIQLLASQKNYRQAIEWGLCTLAELGLKIPPNPSKLQRSKSL
jgi:predicted ATPase